MWLPALLGVLLSVGAMVPLDEDPRWRAAIGLLDEFAYDEALDRMAPLAEEEARPEGERAKVLLRMGMIHADLRREAEARRCFELALDLDEAADLPQNASPRMRDWLEEMRASRPARADRPAAGKPAVASSSSASSPAAPASQSGSPGTNLDDGGASLDGPRQAGPAAPGVALGPTLLVAGGLAAATGLLAWGAGLALYGLGEQAHYQQEAASFGEVGATSQLAGQGLLAVGVVVVVAGAAFLALEP